MERLDTATTIRHINEPAARTAAITHNRGFRMSSNPTTESPDGNRDVSAIRAQENEVYQRPRAEHIVFSFEQSLGVFVKHHAGGDDHLALSRIPKQTIERIRTESRHPPEADDTIEWLVENSYLNTLFDLAVNAPIDAELVNAASNLRKWCQHVGVFEIRNVIAHPNRKWIPHYWHVVSALATHPIVFQLELQGVVDSLAAAETGQFDPPPDSWRLRVAEIEIPNNLSDAVRPSEHGAFVGRKTERAELTRRILLKRFPYYSIVAPGGLGKTALLLACLQEIVRNHQARSRFDLIVFLSSKSKLLTASGEIDVKADIGDAKSLPDQLSQAVLKNSSGTWDQLLEIYGKSRLLLCLDNVEDILLETPWPIDQLLLDGFPETWTVVLTSRIPVNNTSEFRLDLMNFEDKRALVYNYSQAIGLSLGGEEATRVAERATSPLAIRIWIDFLRQGHEQDEAFNRMNQLTIQFAYSKLVDGIEQDARLLIEALFALDRNRGRGSTRDYPWVGCQPGEGSNFHGRASVIDRPRAGRRAADST